jgi:cobyrinic acid a,c-diamide synthase
MRPALLIGGVSSGCGKTTAVLGLMAAMKQRGLRVQGFKVGPDYIDPGLHAQVTGRPSWNLDGWMGDRDSVRHTFARVMAGQTWPDLDAPDIGIVEGVMGLYDGADGASDRGSSAEIAAWLGIPVVLVVDARGLARSIAAIARGYSSLREDLPLAGVIATRVASANHADLLYSAMEQACPDIPLLACLPPDDRISRPSRHLGLHSAETDPLTSEQQHVLAEWFREHADLSAFAALASGFDLDLPERAASSVKAHIAVASDKAFCFIYPAMIDALRRAGARISFFSPLEDAALPPCDGVWLPGGYPELFAKRLAANRSMADSMRRAVDAGVPVHGECGGYIWLMEALEVDGMPYPMLGCLPGTARLHNRRAALGYRQARLLSPCALGLDEHDVRGHEFHYSALTEDVTALYRQAGVNPLWEVRDRKGRELGPEGMVRGRVSGTWIHVHPDSDPDLARRFLAACVGESL